MHFKFFLIQGSKMNTNTDKNILEDSYQLVKHFLDFSLWEYSIASFD